VVVVLGNVGVIGRRVVVPGLGVGGLLKVVVMTLVGVGGLCRGVVVGDSAGVIGLVAFWFAGVGGIIVVLSLAGVVPFSMGVDVDVDVGVQRSVVDVVFSSFAGVIRGVVVVFFSCWIGVKRVVVVIFLTLAGVTGGVLVLEGVLPAHHNSSIDDMRMTTRMHQPLQFMPFSA